MDEKEKESNSLLEGEENGKAKEKKENGERWRKERIIDGEERMKGGKGGHVDGEGCRREGKEGREEEKKRRRRKR